MKIKKIFYVWVFALMLVTEGNAQIWAPTGSVWHYGILESFFSQNQGYLKVESIGDTSIQGQQCKILHKTRYNASTHMLTDEGNDYMYSLNDKVFHFMNDTFYTLYNFNAMPGDTWTVAVPFPSPFASLNPPDTLVKIVVDSVSTITIQSQILRTLYVHSDSNDWYFLNPIIEGIGSMGGMFPFIYDWMDDNIPFFRCYVDTSFFYQRNLAYPCDTVIDKLDESSFYETFDVFPNPATNYFMIKMGIPKLNYSTASLRIFDEFGREVIFKKITIEEIMYGIKINSETFGDGIYQVLLFLENPAMMLRTKIIINHVY